MLSDFPEYTHLTWIYLDYILIYQLVVIIISVRSAFSKMMEQEVKFVPKSKPGW